MYYDPLLTLIGLLLVLFGAKQTLKTGVDFSEKRSKRDDASAFDKALPHLIFFTFMLALTFGWIVIIVFF